MSAEKTRSKVDVTEAVLLKLLDQRKVMIEEYAILDADKNSFTAKFMALNGEVTNIDALIRDLMLGI